MSDTAITSLLGAGGGTYLICGIAVPNDEFAILRGTDQEPTQMRRPL